MRTRIDWKYALNLELEDEGFHFSVLCEFRARLIQGNAEGLLFETMLNELKRRGFRHPPEAANEPMPPMCWLQCGQLIVWCVWEKPCVRRSGILAEVAPEWLCSFAPEEWYERYAHRIEEYRLPKGKEKRREFVETVGADGATLLEAIFTTPELNWLRHVRAVEILRRVWVQQFEVLDGHWHFREDENIPPTAKMICSPSDIEATYGHKLTSWWVGYKVHLRRVL